MSCIEKQHSCNFIGIVSPLQTEIHPQEGREIDSSGAAWKHREAQAAFNKNAVGQERRLVPNAGHKAAANSSNQCLNPSLWCQSHQGQSRYHSGAQSWAQWHRLRDTECHWSPHFPQTESLSSIRSSRSHNSGRTLYQYLGWEHHPGRCVKWLRGRKPELQVIRLQISAL